MVGGPPPPPPGFEPIQDVPPPPPGFEPLQASLPAEVPSAPTDNFNARFAGAPSIDTVPEPVSANLAAARRVQSSVKPPGGRKEGGTTKVLSEYLPHVGKGIVDMVAQPGRALQTGEYDPDAVQGLGLAVATGRLNRLPRTGQTSGGAPLGELPAKTAPAPEAPPPPPGFEPVPRSLSGGAVAEPPMGAAALPPTYPEAVAAVQSRIAPTPKQSNLPNVRDLVTEVVDDLNPVARAERQALGGDLAPTLDSPYQQMRLTRGAGGKVEQFLQNGTFDFDTLANRGPSFVDAVKPIRKMKDDFKSYLVAARDLELEGRGIATGVDSNASQVVLKEAPKEFKAAAEKLNKYQDDLLEYAKRSGLIAEDAIAEMRAANRQYIPFYRLLEGENSGPFPSRGLQTGSPTRTIKGSERQILDPLESVIRNTQTIIQKAENNRALQTLERFSEAHPELGIMKRAENPARPIEIQPGEIARIADDLNVPGIGHNGGPALTGNETFTIWRRSDRDLGPNQINVWRDGKPHRYDVDPDIAQAIKGMDNLDTANFLKMLGAPSRMLRAGVVLDPTYMARNFTRDQFSATMQSGNNYYPVWDFAKGLTERVKGGETYQNWLKAGGAQSALMSLDRTSAAVKLASKYGQDPTLGGKVKNVVSKPLDVLRVMSQVIDEATRLGEFKNATKGKTDIGSLQEGGMASRDVTTDFAKHGRNPQVRALSQISEFMNAQIQGTSREAQAVRRNPARTAAVGLAAITLPSVYLWVANHDDPRYKNAPSWEKDAYWLIMPSDPKQEPWRIPKPFTFGLLLGSAVERSLDAFVAKKPEAFKGFATSLGNSVIPNFIPTIAKPFYEKWANKSSFTGQPIEPKRLQNLPPSERYTETTPEPYKKLGKGVATVFGENEMASPLMLQNYTRAWGGTLGQNIVQLGDSALAKIGLTDKAPAPTKGLADIPVIRAFVSRYPTAGAQPIQDFYEKNTELEQKVNARREARRRGDEAGARSYEEQLDGRTQGFKKQLDAGHKEVRRVLNDREMTPDQKREAIKREYLQMLDTAQRGLSVMREVQTQRELRKQPATDYKGP